MVTDVPAPPDPAATRRPRTPWRADRWTDLSRIKVLALVAPLLFLVLVESLRFGVIEHDIWAEDPREAGGHLALAVLTLLSIVAFSLLMFVLIDRAQRRMLRQNRELAAANAVAAAVRGTGSPTEIADATIDALLAAVGAEQVDVVLHPRGLEQITRSGRADGLPSEHVEEFGYDPCAITVPLTAGAESLGVLRIRMCTSDDEPPLSLDTVQTIGQQMAAAVQTSLHIDDLASGRKRGHAFFEALLQVSSQAPLPETLLSTVRHLRDMLGAESAVLLLHPSITRHLVSDAQGPEWILLPDGGMCVCTCSVHDPALRCGCEALPMRSPAETGGGIATAVRGPWGVFGELWVTEADGRAFGDGERRFLETMAEIVSIAVTNARMRQTQEHMAVVGERDRIAREMHDGMAQVLAVTHLRLRALEGRSEILGTPVADEVESLAQMCHEAYSDVRETILGLRETSRPDRTLLESLQAYLDAYTRQCGIPTRLVRELDADPVMPLRCEVQILRVVQEALTNARKHSRAGLVTVRVGRSPEGTTFTVEDDGAGFDASGPAGRSDSYGLHTMAERMGMVNGTLTVDSAPGRGTRIVATVPVASAPMSSEVSRAGI